MTTPADQHTDFANPRPDDSSDDDGRAVPESSTGTAVDTEPRTSTDLGTDADQDADHTLSAGEAGDDRAHEGRAHEGNALHDTAHGDANGSAAAAVTATTSSGTDADGRERLVSQERADSYGTRWDSVKGTFVDDPRTAVVEADKLVGELLEELQELFRSQRQGLEEGLAADETSTEDLRLGLRRYRSFFDRLLSL